MGNMFSMSVTFGEKAGRKGTEELERRGERKENE
jgi:hypothetical protein